jgi:metallo-beta-lactamase class B
MIGGPMKRVSMFLLAVAMLVSWPARPYGVVVAGQQDDEQRRAWNQPAEPFHIIGNIHYVGAAGVSAFLITTSEGSIILDGALPETVPQIVKNVAQLGFKLSDVKFLLNSHAHFDHAGGLAELQKLTGARFVASTSDAPALRAGAPSMPAVQVDRVVTDGETVQLGGTTLKAYVTPGHTRGCTTWGTTVVEGGQRYTVLFYCSTTVVDRLVGNAGYPQIVEDYQRTFARLRGMSADVLLANHPEFIDMDRKRKQKAAGGPNPFVDPSEWSRFVTQSETQFKAALERERTQARP